MVDFSGIDSTSMNKGSVRNIQGGNVAGSRTGSEVQKQIDVLQNSKNIKDREAAVDVLKNLAEKNKTSAEDKQSMVQPLITALSDKTPYIRSGAAETLGILVGPKSKITLAAKESMVKPLIEASKQANVDAHNSAVYALTNLVASDISRESKMQVLDELINVQLNPHFDPATKDFAEVGVSNFLSSGLSSEDKAFAIDFLNEKLKGTDENMQKNGVRASNVDVRRDTAYRGLIAELSK
jgi:HEAT repeat protein